MSSSVESLRAATASKTDEGLYDLVSAHWTDYTLEALKAAKAELTTRNLTAPKLTELDNAAGEKLRREQEPLE